MLGKTPEHKLNNLNFAQMQMQVNKNDCLRQKQFLKQLNFPIPATSLFFFQFQTRLHNVKTDLPNKGCSSSFLHFFFRTFYVDRRLLPSGGKLLAFEGRDRLVVGQPLEIGFRMSAHNSGFCFGRSARESHCQSMVQRSGKCDKVLDCQIIFIYQLKIKITSTIC